ncbi:MAG: SDR family oxidoreductase [Proteobacteria bacterium]|nr:SDR family oxidoreductase [Pseudomonadota bacterium]
MRLENKVALITGAGSGIGRESAILFSREGAAVVCVDINEAAAQETVGLIEGEDGVARAHRADVTKADQVDAMVARALELWGKIDILHNNVGIVEAGGPVEADEASWDRVIAVNLKSMYLTCKAVLPVMEAAGRGAIVNIGSVAGIRWLGVPYVAYAASKAAILGFTRSIALQYARKGIRANVILPGLMDTPMYVGPLKQAYAGGDIDKMKDLRREQCPMGRMGDAWDVAKAALFLASDEANYITAAELVVDGGLTAKVS